jgi:acyl-CoA reductase-like NAD-dependent aldehyde dehydrogenase
MISFTGSAEVGWKYQTAKANKKTVSLELGGNAPVIVDESANLRHSIDRRRSARFPTPGKSAFPFSAFMFTKKSSTNGRKIYLKARNLKKGNPLDETTELSAMIDEKAAKKAQSWVTEAKRTARKYCAETRATARCSTRQS